MAQCDFFQLGDRPLEFNFGVGNANAITYSRASLLRKSRRLDEPREEGRTLSAKATTGVDAPGPWPIANQVGHRPPRARRFCCFAFGCDKNSANNRAGTAYIRLFFLVIECCFSVASKASRAHAKARGHFGSFWSGNPFMLRDVANGGHPVPWFWRRPRRALFSEVGYAARRAKHAPGGGLFLRFARPLPQCRRGAL
ncbi:hypothetical protein TRVL_09464 [Trypanosoma vivax]|nr:hypothetical protein TRVL_09464 [Trypanosoma vivax]